jgi:hypothetical protein
MSAKKKHISANLGRKLDAGPAWLITYYLTQEESAPAVEFLRRCPIAIRAQFVAALHAVAAAPPPRFSGGGIWEAMHGAMSGWYEIRITGPGREQFRLFCLLENGTSEELARRRSGVPGHRGHYRLAEALAHNLLATRLSARQGTWR